MLQSVRTFQPVTKAITNPARSMSRSYAMPSDYYDPSGDDDEEDYFSESLADINFDQLEVDDSREFTYDEDSEEDIDDDDEDMDYDDED